MLKKLTALDCQIVHQIPGRMRIKLPNLFDVPANVERLQQDLAGLQGVRNLRINPAAKSIAIEYQERQISEVDLQKQLAAILTKIALKTPDKATSNEPIATQSISLEEVNSLTPYEQTQLEQLERWRSQEPQFLLAIATIAIPIKTFSDWIVPEAVIEQSLALCDVLASRWQEDWESLKQEAGIKTPIELQQTKLEVCDRLCERVKNWETWMGGALASITGFFEGIGEITEIPLSVVLALHTIRKIGLCYGYPPQTQQERLLGWSILAIATAQTSLEKQQAFSAFYHWQNTLYRQMFDEILEDTLDEKLFDSIREAVFRQAIVYLSEDLSGDNIPFVGSVLGAIANSSFINEVSESAHRAYQIRWLLANQKLHLNTKLMALENS